MSRRTSAARRPVRWRTLACLCGAAAGYFLLGITQGIEPIDEGHLTYLSWRVSEGALPYRSFQHWYGPSVFFLNGLLFRLAGPDLVLVRLVILVLRVVLVMSVFLLTRAVAGAAPALLASGVVVVIWGAPLWFFNAPYAINYQLPLTLAGLAVYLLAPGAPSRRLLIAGACLGLGATFRQTGGVLAFVGFVLFLLAREEAAEKPPRLDSHAIPWRGARITLIAGALAVLGIFSVSGSRGWELVLLTLPIAILAVGILAQGWGGGPPEVVGNVTAVGYLAGGFAIAPIAYAGWYAAHGALPALVWATLLGLPQKFCLNVPFPPPAPRTLVGLGVAAISIVALRAGRAPGPGAPAVQRLLLPASCLAVGILVYRIATTVGLSSYLRQGFWLGEVSSLLFWLPPATVWATCLALLRLRPGEQSEPVLALTFVASALLPSLAPVADAPHLLMILPIYLPLVGYGLWVRSADSSAPAPRRLGAVVLVSAWIVVLATPFVFLLVSSRLDRRPGVTFARATHITDRSPLGHDLHALVAYLRTHPGSGDRLLAVPSHAMIYFLTDRASALEDDEFFFYAATYGPQLSPADARALVDQGDAMRRLEAERPLIVRFGAAPGERAFRQAFPVLNRYIDRRYGSVATFGQYAVLAWGPRHESTRGLPSGRTAPIP